MNLQNVASQDVNAYIQFEINSNDIFVLVSFMLLKINYLSKLYQLVIPTVIGRKKTQDGLEL